MKEWNFTFTPIGGANWGWNTVRARGVKSAINKANKWVKKNFPDHELDVNSVNCNHDTYMMLLRAFD